MGVQNYSENILILDLPSDDQHIGNELKNLNELVHQRSDCDVVIDCARVEIITSANLSNLLVLRHLLREHGCQLILCNVSVSTKGIFTVAGLDAVFEFTIDKESALAAVRQGRENEKPTNVSSQ